MSDTMRPRHPPKTDKGEEVTLLAAPIQSIPWSEDIPCTITRNDPTIGTPKTIRLCAATTIGDARTHIACWEPDKGWIEESFAQTPIARIKGWLELAESLLRNAKTVENPCERIFFWRAATDAFACVDRITTDSNVRWHPAIAQMYSAVRGKVTEIARLFETTIRQPDGSTDAYQVLLGREQQVDELAEATKLTHNNIQTGASEIEAAPGVDPATYVFIGVAIVAGGLAAMAPGATLLGVIGTALLAVAAVWFVSSVVGAIIDWIFG
jgi:hypothetical protein